MDDKIKHRIVGIVVIAAFLVILVPALIKNVVWHEEKPVVPQQPLNIPAPPPSPQVNAEGQLQNFQTTQIAQVSLDQPTSAAQPLTQQNNAATTENALATSSTEPATPAVLPLETPKPVTVEPSPAPKPAPAPKPVPVPAPKPVVVKKVVVKPVPAPIVAPVQKTVTITPSAQKPVKFCLQMGTFANPANAQLLVTRLKQKGFYGARSETVILPSGQRVNRVSVCRSMTRAEAMTLRARAAQLIGTNAIIIRQEG